MNGLSWFRFYNEALNDQKVQSLPPPLFKFWVNLLCLACQQCGVFVQGDISFKLRMTPRDAKKMLGELVQRGLIDETKDGLSPHNWGKRQFSSDSSTERTQRWRERQRERHGKRHGDALDTDTDTDTDTEQSRTDTERAREPDAIFQLFWKAYPRKIAEEEARKAWPKALEIAPAQDIIAGAKRFASETQGQDLQFLKHPATWLNDKRWNDAPGANRRDVRTEREKQRERTREHVEEALKRAAANGTDPQDELSRLLEDEKAGRSGRPGDMKDITLEAREIPDAKPDDGPEDFT